MTRFVGALCVVRRRRAAGALAAAACVAASSMSVAAAPSPLDGPEAPPVDTLVAIALVRAPEIAAQRERAAAARARAGGAAAFADPMLELSLQDADFPDWTVGDQDMSMLGIDVQQTLPFPGKRGHRRRAAAAEAAMPAVERQTIERTVTANVRALYARLFALDRTAIALASSRASLRALEDVTAARYASGTSELEPRLAAQLAVSRLDERTEDLTAERRIVVAALNRVLDRDAETAIGTVAALPSVESPRAGWQADAVMHAPAVLAARAAVTAAAQRVAVERSERRPDWTLGGGYGYRGDLGPLVSLRIGTELPFWRRSRQEPRVRAAEHELEAARHDLRRAEADAGVEAVQLLADWQRADAQVRRYHDAIVPQSRTTLDAVRVAYETGRGSFATVIQYFNAWIETQEQLAAREAARFTAHARLMALVSPADAAAAEEATP